MAFKSEAQRRKFHDLHRQGKISKEVLEAFESSTSKKIPERVKPPKKIEKPKPAKAWKAKIHGPK